MSKKVINYETKESSASSSQILTDSSHPFDSSAECPKPDVDETALADNKKYILKDSEPEEPPYWPLNMESGEPADPIYFGENDELDLIPYDIININISNPKNITYQQKKIEVTGVKKNGVTPGLMLGIGMLKFGKYISKKNLSFFKKAMPVNHEAVLEELLATNISIILELPASNLRMVLVETSQEQIDQFVATKQFKEKSPDSKTIFVPALLSVFDNNSVELSKMAAGNNGQFNQAHTKPLGEGNFSNKLMGKDYAKLSLFTYLTNDPDTIGSQAQNKLLLPSGKVFSIDTQVLSSNQITMGRDGRLSSSFFESRIAVAFNKNLRHISFRNCSMINDNSFPEMFDAVKDLLISGKDQLILNEFQKAEKAYKSQEFPQKEEFLTRITQLKSVMMKRLNHIRKTFQPYWDLYQQCTGENIFDKSKTPDLDRLEVFQKMGASLVALEELLSPSKMYSDEGVPLRAPNLPANKHYFWHEFEMGSFPKISFKGNKLTISLNNVDPQLSARLQKLFGLTQLDSFFTCSFYDFTRIVTAERVRLLTHPETLSLKTAQENKININYIQGLPAFDIKDEKLTGPLKSHFELFKFAKESTEKFDCLRVMFDMINNKIPKDILTSTAVAHDQGWGELVASRAKIIREQQKILAGLFKEEKTFTHVLGSTDIYDLFAKADLLDISHCVNELLYQYNQKTIPQQAVKEMIAKISAVRIPTADIFEVSESVASLRQEINQLTQAAVDSLGLPSNGKSASRDFGNSIIAMREGRLSITNSSQPSASIPAANTGLQARPPA